MCYVLYVQCPPYVLVIYFFECRENRVGHNRSHGTEVHGYDILDEPIGRLHTNFQVSATLSKKVLIFVLKEPIFYRDPPLKDHTLV